MKLIIATVFFSSVFSLAASKVVQKTRVLSEKIISAESCSITGKPNSGNSTGYGSVGYQYTATMKIKVVQKIETYSVEIKKSLFGKTTETIIANSSKASPDKTEIKTQSVTYEVRYPSEEYVQVLQKGCEDEMIFVNTGSYPTPPQKPVVVEEPKKDPAKTPTPVTPESPALEPIQAPGLPGEVPASPIFPVEIPGTKG